MPNRHQAQDRRSQGDLYATGRERRRRGARLPESFSDWTYEELLQHARELGIYRPETMAREMLLEALRER